MPMEKPFTIAHMPSCAKRVRGLSKRGVKSMYSLDLGPIRMDICADNCHCNSGHGDFP